MHWAENINDANEIIAQLIERQNGKTVVKGKSMVSEETALNDYLADRNIECLESDMGEYIVQLAKRASIPYYHAGYPSKQTTSC